MPSFELFEFLIFLIFIAGMFNIPYMSKHRKDIMKYAPGIMFLLLSVIFTNVEAFILPELFNFFEHFCILLSGVSMAIAMFFEAFKGKIKITLTRSEKKIKKNNKSDSFD
ncbi:MAG: hypothetical protein ACFFDH_03990 [Promethearchaeota archaeon]